MLKIAYHPIYKLELQKGHRFPMEKYDLLPQQLLHEATCTLENFFEPVIPNDKHFFTVHDSEYFYNLLNITLPQKAARKIGFPLSEILIEREMIIADGTMKASEFALKHGVAMNIAGGTHHAFSNRGEAFCMLNDQAIGAKYLQNKRLVNKVLIIDLDVHQGNGTAEIFRNDNSVFTFSMHGKTNYPFQKEISDWDIALENDTEDFEYLTVLKEVLPKIIKQEKPDFIYYLCGVDVLKTDKLGKLSLTINGCKERDKFVLQTCHNLKIPVMCSMGGGYSKDINIIINAHANTFRLAQEIYF
ncbi:histone deacetylase family protein [Polaribacter sp. OB-PA-B3]